MMGTNVLCFAFLLCSCLAADEGWFWHLTDFHYDFSYWTDQLSCNGMNITQPGAFGSQWCDSPWSLVDETVRGIQNIRSDVDFIIWTGDSVPHVAAGHLSVNRNLELVRNITDLMKAQFPDVKIYATFGNHDYHPKNMFPPHGNEIYNATYIIWEQWINATSQEDNFRKGGYYTVLVGPKLRLIALNTNLYYTSNTVTMDIDDPADQFAWLDAILADSARNNEKVILTGHVPPGYNTPRNVRWMREKFNKKFVDIILRNSDVIVALHFGHEHHDSFRLFYKDGKPVVPLFIAPSVTPWRFQILGEIEPPHNPGARLVKYDRTNGKQLDIIQYYVDLADANAKKTLSWLPGYTATDLYNIADVSSVSMDTVVRRMSSRTNADFKHYVNWYNTNANASVEYPCNEECFTAVKCGFEFLTEGPFQKCLAGSAVNRSNEFVGNCLLCYIIPLTIAMIILQCLF